jgi:hypothetical protein
MEHARSEDEWAAGMRRIAESQRAELDLLPPDWPVYALAEPPEPGCLAGWDSQDGVLGMVLIGYGTSNTDGWVQVETRPRRQATLRPLDWLLAERFAADGLEYPVPGALPPSTFDELPDAPRAEPVELLVGGVPVAGLGQRVGPYVAWRVTTADLVLTVTGRVAAAPALTILTDPGLYLRPGPRPARAHHEPAPTLTGPDGTAPLWAHRELLAMTMAGRDEHLALLALNRPFLPLDPLWGSRWRTAVVRQQILRDQDHDAARDAISAMVQQIGDLQQYAAWWSDERLAARAVDEVIWVTATGEENVPSAPAQRAWAHEPLLGRDAWQDWADRAPS